MLYLTSYHLLLNLPFFMTSTLTAFGEPPLPPKAAPVPVVCRIGYEPACYAVTLLERRQTRLHTKLPCIDGQAPVYSVC